METPPQLHQIRRTQEMGEGVMKWRKIPLKLVAPAKAASVRFKADDPVWQLTLDQIEADTGNVVNKKVAPAKEAGTSTHGFDSGNVLYSKLRPYLNKVIRPHERGIATTELVPLRPNPAVLDADFLTYYLRSAPFVQFASQFVAGAKMPRVVMGKFWEHGLR
jgi:type I restriction enzyme, S subunit